MTEQERLEKREAEQRKQSIRNSLRYFIMQDLDVKIVLSASIEDIMLELLKPFKKVSAAEIGAARQVAKFIKSDSNRAFMTDNIDGKLPQAVNLQGLNLVLKMSDEELENVVEGHKAARADNAANGGTGGNGTPAPESGTRETI